MARKGALGLLNSEEKKSCIIYVYFSGDRTQFSSDSQKETNIKRLLTIDLVKTLVSFKRKTNFGSTLVTVNLSKINYSIFLPH